MEEENKRQPEPTFIPPACAYGGPLQGDPTLNKLKGKLKEKLTGKKTIPNTHKTQID